MDSLTDAGVVLITATAVFTIRVVCEQTLLTWTGRVQTMRLFPPPFGLDLVGLLCVILGGVWAVAVVVLSIAERRRISPANRGLIALLLLCCGLWLVPYEEWKVLMVRTHGVERTPKSWIVRAAASGEIRLLDYLLANGADVNTRTRSGQSPLGAAAAAGQVDAAKLLIARRADLENRTLISLETPLTEAAQMNHSDIVILLLEHGADMNVHDVMGLTALDWAQQVGK
jgi:ankyrin repeat protein